MSKSDNLGLYLVFFNIWIFGGVVDKGVKKGVCGNNRRDLQL